MHPLSSGLPFPTLRDNSTPQDRATPFCTQLTLSVKDSGPGIPENCIHFVETSPSEKEVKDHKWYAPRVGCVKDGDIPLVRIEGK